MSTKQVEIANLTTVRVGAVLFSIHAARNVHQIRDAIASTYSDIHVDTVRGHLGYLVKGRLVTKVGTKLLVYQWDPKEPRPKRDPMLKHLCTQAETVADGDKKVHALLEELMRLEGYFDQQPLFMKPPKIQTDKGALRRAAEQIGRDFTEAVELEAQTRAKARKKKD